MAGIVKLCESKQKQLISLFEKGVDVENIAQQLEVGKGTVGRFVRKNNLKRNANFKRKAPIVDYDKKYNHLKITGIEFDYKLRIWKVITICDCGNVTNTTINYLEKGYKKTCGIKGCKYHVQVKTENAKITFTGYEGIYGGIWRGWQISAEKRDIPFNLTIEDAWDKFLQQDKKCALSGIEISFNLRHDGERTASLDRIDSSKGYEINNIQWVHKDINLMKRAMPEDEFIKICKLIVENHERKVIDQGRVQKTGV